MCDPTGGLLTASAITTALGAGASLYGQQKQQQAYNAVENAQANAQRQSNAQAMQLQQAERARQQGYQQQSQGLLNNSLQYNSPANQQNQLAQQQNALGNQYTSALGGITNPSSIPGLTDPSGGASGTPQIVSDAYRSALNQTGNFLNQQAGAKAGMDAFSNQNAANTMYNARQLQQQGLLGNFMQGSTSALANELAANNENANLAFGKADIAGNGLANQAAIANGLGGIGLNLGISGLTAGIGRAGGINGFLGGQAPKTIGYGLNGAQYTSTPYFTPVKLN
jgi:hypothetical protein